MEKIIFKSVYNTTRYLSSGEAVTMVKKVKNRSLPDCDDIHLIPPIVFKNSLPVPLFVYVHYKNTNPMKLERMDQRHLCVFNSEGSIEADIWIEGFHKK